LALSNPNAVLSDSGVPVLPANQVFARLPERVVDSLTREQKEAIHQAIDGAAMQQPPVNVRFSLPILGRRYFLTFVAGPERRGIARREGDRRRHPLGTATNFTFFACLGILIYAIAIFGIYMHGALSVP
jgi:hypothetical protein